MNQSAALLLELTILAALLAGCAQPSLVEKNFGASVREMQASQRYVPADAPSRPYGNAPQDPAKTSAVLEAYRADVAKPEEVTDEIRIRVGGSSR